MFFHDDAQVLSDAECQDLLASTNLGRIALTIRALPVIMPVNYGYLGGSVILGMSDGPARRALAEENVIALGVDSSNLTDVFWALLVIGKATEVTDTPQRAQFQSLGLADPTGLPASHYLQLQPDILTGYRTSARPPANHE
jgi:nitroimidazol reductase NimA-like FMN-containing flavoprotein (pyridoxamine 5'-phosphate oxidase superfamily)